MTDFTQDESTGRALPESARQGANESGNLSPTIIQFMEQVDLGLILFIWFLLTYLTIRCFLSKGDKGFSSESVPTIIVPLQLASTFWFLERVSPNPAVLPDRLVYYILNSLVSLMFFVAGRNLILLQKRLHFLMRRSGPESKFWISVRQVVGARSSVFMFSTFCIMSVILSVRFRQLNSPVWAARLELDDIPAAVISTMGMIVLGVGLLREFTREKTEFISIALSGSVILYGLVQLPRVYTPLSDSILVLSSFFKIWMLLVIACYWTLITQMKRVQDEEERRWRALALNQKQRIQFSIRRDNIVVDLHNHVLTKLSGAGLYAKSLHKMIELRDLKSAANLLRQLEFGLDAAEDQIRKIMSDSSNRNLDEGELRSALEELASELERRAGIRVYFRFDSKRSMPQYLENAFFDIATEAMFNAERHSIARNVNLEVLETAGFWILKVEDDGIGWNNELGTGIGLMRKLARSVGYKLNITQGDNLGTKLTVAPRSLQVLAMAHRPGL